MFNYYASKWKREPINDHKFEFINIHDFRDTRFSTQINYCYVILLILKSIFIYVADIWTTLVLLGVVDNGFSFLPSDNKLKYVFLASITCSFLILLWDIRKSLAIHKSGDIAFAFTDIICYNLNSLKCFSYYCLFHRIEQSKNYRDTLAFFVFFRLKRWKRIMLAEAPRQIINGYTLYTRLLTFKDESVTFNKEQFLTSVVQSASLGLIIISFTLFFFSVVAIIIAVFLYVPLICQIQGNLKEYVCHKIDKRIAKVIKSKANRRRFEKERREKLLNDTMKTGSPNSSSLKIIPSPTLPNVIIDDDELRNFTSFRSDHSRSTSSAMSDSSMSLKNSIRDHPSPLSQSGRPSYERSANRAVSPSSSSSTNRSAPRTISPSTNRSARDNQNSKPFSSHSLTSSSSTNNGSIISIPNFPMPVNHHQHPSTIIDRKPAPLQHDADPYPRAFPHYRPRPSISPQRTSPASSTPSTSFMTPASSSVSTTSTSFLTPVSSVASSPPLSHPHPPKPPLHF